MKRFLLIVPALLGLELSQSSAQVTVSAIPTTPLDHFVHETAMPKTLSGYTKMSAEIGLGNSFFPLAITELEKYSDIPLYSSFAESIDFFSSLESKAVVSRTSSYVSYELQVREAAEDPFQVYSRDTFYLSGTKITSITEVKYDESSSGRKLAYDVVYDGNNITEIKLKAAFLDDLEVYDFGRLKVVYNPNQTIKSDTIYEGGYESGSGEITLKIATYDQYFYNVNNALKVDSSFYFDLSREPVQSDRFKYTLNGNNEIVTANIYTYDDESETYEQSGRIVFSKTTSTSIAKGLAQKGAIQVYPNPVVSTLYVSGSKEAKTYSIIDQKGNLMKTGTYDVSEGVNVDFLEKGQYFLYLNNDKEAWTGKFIK